MYFMLIVVSLFAPCTAFLSLRELRNVCDHSTDVDYTNGVVALILARGGSKGIPYKNLAKIDGVSMLGRALRIANNCNCFVEVWVSTDSEKIAREAYRHNVNVHYRSEYSARDEATSLESIQEFLNGHRHIKNIALIQCTSVFLSEQYLIAAVDTFTLSTHNIECVFSVYRSRKLRWKPDADTKYLKAINFNPQQRPRRQDWPGELVETGMFYLFRRHLIETMGLLQSDRCEYVEIDERHALEIDNPMQLFLANILSTIPEW